MTVEAANIIHNVSTIQMEEKIPIFMSNQSQMAPQEMVGKKEVKTFVIIFSPSKPLGQVRAHPRGEAALAQEVQGQKAQVAQGEEQEKPGEQAIGHGPDQASIPAPKEGPGGAQGGAQAQERQIDRKQRENDAVFQEFAGKRCLVV